MSENTNQKNAAEPQTETNLFTLVDSDGREWLLRPVPKHFFLMYGQMPSTLSDRAMLALKQGDQSGFEQEVASTLTEKEIYDNLMFLREAVKYICVKPKISLTPQNDDEVSPFDISEEAFAFLSRWAMQSLGGGKAAGLNSFRRQSGGTSGNRANGKKLSKKSK